MAGLIRFDGRVVVVTGAGRGLGRSYARLLASRGARVVVSNRSADAAEAVVAEIVDAGGEAVAAVADLFDDGSPEAVVETALGAYGRIDALVNNAAVTARDPRPFAEAELRDLEEMVDVHVYTPWRMTKAVWPHLVAAGYGRVVFTSSLAVFGVPTQVAYATAKSALHGLARCLAVDGASHGILVNTVLPTAATRLMTARTETNATFYDWALEHMTPDHVAPLVAVLVHEACPVSGELVSARAGQFHLVPLGFGGGLTLDDAELSPEAVLERFAEVVDPAGFVRPETAFEAVGRLRMPPPPS
jgi:NAD(P)-dependent dehydrogenase (short-subunit alcohol dehydrogenase family)